MADDLTPDSASATPSRRRRTDVPLLLTGLLTVSVAAYVFVDGTWNVQWLLALGAVAIGVAMLVSSLRPRGS